MKDIAVFGAGGFGREVSCIIKRINKVSRIWNFVGFFDDNERLTGTRNEYGEVLGTGSDLNEWEGELAVVIGVGSPAAVKEIVGEITKPVEYPNLIDPDVTFFDESINRIGKGNIILAKCLISTNVCFGDFNILNANAGIGHDVNIGSFNCLMPNVNISGGVNIGDCNFFGVKATVLQYLKIGSNTKVGANSVIMKNTNDGFLYFGNPAVKMKIY